MIETDVREHGATTGEYRARFCEHDGRVVECTIYPSGLSDERLVTTWISAATGSFVDLAAVR